MENRLEGWQSRIQAADATIRAGAYERALADLEQVKVEIIERSGPGEAVRPLLGLVVLLQSIAEAGTGDFSAAVWHWDLVTGFAPSIVEGFDVSRLGGELGRHARERRSSSAQSSEPPIDFEAAGGSLLEPKKIDSEPPPYPPGALYFGIEGVVVIQAVIDSEGAIVRPRVLKSLDPATFDYLALETLRTWRFRPAALDGRPVAVHYNLALNFKLRSE